MKAAIQAADVLLEKGITLVGNDFDFVFDGISEVKPAMIEEATANARTAAGKFAQDSNSRVGRIRRATQGAMEIRDRDAASPELEILRVVTTVYFFLE